MNYRFKNLIYIKDWFDARFNTKLSTIEADPDSGLAANELERLKYIDIYDKRNNQYPCMIVSYNNDNYNQSQIDAKEVVESIDFNFFYQNSDEVKMHKNLLYYVDAIIQILKDNQGQTLDKFEVVDKSKVDYMIWAGNNSSDYYGIVTFSVEVKYLEW